MNKFNITLLVLILVIVIAGVGTVLVLNQKKENTQPTQNERNNSQDVSSNYNAGNELPEEQNINTENENTDQENSEKNIQQKPDNVIFSIPYCISKDTANEYLEFFMGDKNVNYNLVDSFFENERIKEINSVRYPYANWRENIYQVCYTNENNIAFVAYGDFGEQNNAIGIFDGKNFTEYKTFNRPMGDIGLCNIVGYLENTNGDNIVYSCGGGDGGSWHLSFYQLNKSSGQNNLLKSCGPPGDFKDCKIDNIEYKSFN